jgi:hypothetical protein
MLAHHTALNRRNLSLGTSSHIEQALPLLLEAPKGFQCRYRQKPRGNIQFTEFSSVGLSNPSVPFVGRR